MAHILPVSAFLFLAFMYRELLMDIADVEGDAAQGVWTLPVVLGKGPAFAVGLVLLAAATCLAVGSPFLGLGMRSAVRHSERAALLGSCECLQSARPGHKHCHGPSQNTVSGSCRIASVLLGGRVWLVPLQRGQ